MKNIKKVVKEIIKELDIGEDIAVEIPRYLDVNKIIDYVRKEVDSNTSILEGNDYYHIIISKIR